VLFFFLFSGSAQWRRQSRSRQGSEQELSLHSDRHSPACSEIVAACLCAGEERRRRQARLRRGRSASWVIRAQKPRRENFGDSSPEPSPSIISRSAPRLQARPPAAGQSESWNVGSWARDFSLRVRGSLLRRSLKFKMPKVLKSSPRQGVMIFQPSENCCNAFLRGLSSQSLEPRR